MMPRADLSFLAGGGEAGAKIRAFDWSSSPVGAPASWPQALRTAVGLLLGSTQPVYVAWGPGLISLYNDGYIPILGSKHPDGLGQPFSVLWSEIWETFQPIVEATMAGHSQHFVDLPIALAGRPDIPVGYFTFSYTALRDEGGRTAGFFCAATETTAQVVTVRKLAESEARLRFLDALSRELATVTSADTAMSTTARMVGDFLGVTICAYADMDEDQNGFTIRGDWSAPGSSTIVGHYRLEDFGKLAVRNLGAGLPLVLNDNLRELAPEEAATFQNIGIAATICMPLVKDGRLTALMAIHDKVPRVWTENELSVIRDVTERSWAHVERVGAEAELRHSEARLRDLKRDA